MAEELKKGSNILFGTVVITMILDPDYQQGDIDSAAFIISGHYDRKFPHVIK